LSNENKNASQSTNNLERKNNPKSEVNQRYFVIQALISRSKYYILVTKTKKKKTCKICKEILSIIEKPIKSKL
jgi:RNase P subunit RPR2